MIIPTALAQEGSTSGGFDLISLLPLILIFVVFYFLLIRPQQKRIKEHKTMISQLRRGDKVITGGGIIGTITRIVSDDEIIVEIAENLRVRVVRATINSLWDKSDNSDVANKPEEKKS